MLRPRDLCGIVGAFGSPGSAAQMLEASPIRALTKAAAISLIVLCSVTVGSVAEAEAATARKACDGQTTSIRKLIRQARSLGGPVAKRVRNRLLRVTTPRTVHIERGIRPMAGDASQAIQNDAPVTHAAVSLTLELEPLGLYVDALERQPFTHLSSPRAPRGPPNRA